ncbi:unnamed protein product [Echinostoma caproni]|uniref:Protein tweety homolog n=1 Tax=Echinostoma caproni TaxID=27848 RepID=A0A183AIM7_9TREM|nr:unnamed protein product [Echinostoma caproni]
MLVTWRQLIVLLVLAIVIWSALACLMSYPVMSIAFLWYRNEGATRLRLASLDLPGMIRQTRAIPFDPTMSAHSQVVRSVNSAHRFLKQSPQIQLQQPGDPVDYQLPGEPPDTSSIYGENTPEGINNWSKVAADADDLQDITREHHPDNYDPTRAGQALADRVDTVVDQSQARGTEVGRNATDLFRSSADEFKDSVTTQAKDYGQRLINKALSASESIAMFFKCSADSIDLSYYGLYDAQGLPIYVARNNLEARTQNILICVCIGISGIFLLILGYLQIVICTAMNYARMQETRYYEASSEVGEEGVALQQ